MPRTTEEILHFAGKELRYVARDEADVSIIAEIFRIREYRIADSIIKSSRNPIFDVGAHCGFFTMYCRALNEKIKIYAIEPEPSNFSALQNHIKINKLKNIKTFEYGIYEKTGKCNLEISNDSHNHRIVAKDTGTTVKCFTFADFCAKERVEKISLLKMDIEGSEYEVVKSLSPSDFLMVENMIMEYHNYDGKDFKEIERILRENGFGVQMFKSKFDKKLGFLFANNKRI